MLSGLSFIRFGTAIIALAAALWLPAASLASGSAGAQLGTVQVKGLTSGSTLSYQLNITATALGTLLSKAKIKSKAWKTTFPDFSATPPLGVSVVDSADYGATVTVPADFVGDATLQVKVTYDGKKIGKVSLLLHFTAPPATPPVPQTTWYDVGFNTNVTVNADAVSTNGLTAPFTYAWTITDTDIRTNATLTTSTNATPTLKTLPITSFEIDLDKEFDLATFPNLVGIDAEQVELTTYHLRVVITDALSVAKTGTVTVTSCNVSPAQATLPLGERQYLTAEPNGTNASTYAWSLVGKPTGSTAVLENGSTRTPSLRPDKEGDYALQVSVRGGGVTNTSYVTLRGAKFVGHESCASCHGTSPQVGLKDIVTPWSQTGHATFFQRSVDGLTSSYYNEGCVSCHTVGYNKSPLAVNSGFDDVQAVTGWKFPAIKQLGNFAAMPAALKNLANISCESCHGPGSQHPGVESTSLDVAVCATCHQDGHYHNRPKQWSLGPHGNDDDYLVASEEEAPNPSCAKCHSPTSFVDYLKGKPLTRLEAGRLTCQGCHDPHNATSYPHQVRIYDDVTLDDSVYPENPPKLTGQGTSALCMFCHNARRGPPPSYVSSGSNGTRLPHESTAVDTLLGIRFQTNVQVIVSGVTNSIATVALENSAHSGVAKCVDCHMHQGSNTVGDHTFSMTDRLSGEGNIAACAPCHDGVDPVKDLDHISVIRAGVPNGGDYDGDGVVYGVQTELNGVMHHLEQKMIATGLIPGEPGPSRWTGYSTNATVRAVQRTAAWNQFMIERDLSRAVHNTALTIRILQWSYTVLSTNTGGNAYSVDFPNADLR